MWAVVAALIVVLAATGTVLANKEVEKQSISIVARVNNDGSGIFVRGDVNVDDLVTIDGGVVTYHPDGWRDMLFMSPGPSSIQHMILMDIVKKKVGLGFVQNGVPYTEPSVRWTQVAPGQMKDMMAKSKDDNLIHGGIAWEPHFANIVASGAKKVISSSQYWEDHPCCVVAVNKKYMDTHGEQVKRFLAAYVKSAIKVGDILETGIGDEYEGLIDLVVRVGAPKEGTLDRNAAKVAMANTTYTYELSNLSDELTKVAETYKGLGLFSDETLTDAGFDGVQDFIEYLIKDGPLSEVVVNDGSGPRAKTPAELSLSDNSYRVDVAYLAADTHQIALHYGIEKGYFQEYGIYVNLMGPYAAGGDVMGALLSEHANIGLVGSPPALLQSINALR